MYSFAPTVINPLVPLMVKWLNASDMFDIRIYKVLFPPVTLIGIIFTVIVFAFTEEKIVQAKTHVVQIRFTDALRAVAKNKYFWIISLAGWLGFLESTQGYILGWLYTYAHMCTDVQYSIITIVYGNASFWGMVAAPFAIKRYGKKNVLIVTNAFNILFIALMYPSIELAHSIWLVFICLWMNALVSSFAHILGPSINADIRDYQHYISGERIDGMFGAVGLIGSFISLITGTVTPMIFDKFGINATNGYKNAFDILKYEPDTLYSLIYLLIFLSVIGAALNVIPYFFYDLSETKQKGMVRILKIRALFEDYGNNALSDGETVEVIDMVRKAREYAGKEKTVLSKEFIAGAKAQTKLKGRAFRKYIADVREYNEEIDIAEMVTAELNKFSTKPVQISLENAKHICENGLQGVYNVEPTVLTAARKLPKTTAEEKLIRSNAVETAKMLLIGKKCAEKHFPNGLPERDYTGELRELFAAEDKLNENLRELYKKQYAAKKQKAYTALSYVRSEIKLARKNKAETEKKIKVLSATLSFYMRAGKAYFDARKLITQEKNYDHFDEIEKLYDEAKSRYERQTAEQKEKEAELEEKRKIEKEALKAMAREKAGSHRKK